MQHLKMVSLTATINYILAAALAKDDLVFQPFADES